MTAPMGTTWLRDARRGTALLGTSPGAEFLGASPGAEYVGARGGAMLLGTGRRTLPASLIAEARRSAALAFDHLMDIRRPDGFWEAAADPRILDTAIVAHALVAGGVGAGTARLDAYRRARRWLQTAQPQRHEPVVEEIDRWLRDLATRDGGPVPPLPQVSPQKYGGRALLVRTLGVSAGAPGADAAELLAMASEAGRAARGQQLKQWQRVIVAAAEVIARVRLDLPVPADLAAALEAEQHPEGSYCLMPAVTGIAYRALRLTGEDSPAARCCLGHIVESQRPDGTWGFVSNDIWDTTLTVRSFRGLRFFDGEVLETSLDFVERAQGADGGWSFKRGLESDNDSTGAALLALAGTAQGRRAWSAARAYARRTQRSDGLWTTWQSADDTPAVDATAHMVAGVNAHSAKAVHTGRATAWLASCYREDLAWKVDWYSPGGYAVNEVASAIGWSHPRSTDGIRFLVEHQFSDGGWPTAPGDASSGPAATGAALSAIAHSGVIVPTETLVDALTYLVDAQRDDGSWDGAPMMYGPRPFLNHFPTHTHAFVVAGLRDLLARLAPPRV